MTVCIIIPMYNEERMAARCLQTLLPFIRDLPETDVVVINDGSSDATAQVVQPFTRDASANVYLLHHEHNQGYGAALKTGVRFAVDGDYDYVLFMDSDLTNHPKYLSRFYEKMHEGYDYIKATRYSYGGGTDGIPLKAYIISRIGNMIARHLFGVPLHDVTNGFRAVRTSLLRDLDLQERGFAIIMEELYDVSALKPRFAEVPYVLTSRRREDGASSFPYTSQTIKTYLSYAFRRAKDRAFGRTRVATRASQNNVPMLRE
ncbi:hypothetical protein A3I45_04160 [Candidatus Uhrbacteria bacterium RIFCSPLOWO2_02_FULL_53_10]|uniref:Glycosyltransferase 2-like domain-containing protein n=1 Tax=Candidatus Uhrbacteria bacterium RIFCSPLOWO2_02_FULL_53_10 TaxID=1802411 RepID=A0A1F7VH17_9BACT|nr:MAG: hypothetical protein A3I45_04160 [Candidatus Uhrbacteria bacterium RIFCSPLOWO2_02_FULL_53_10]